jgi:2-oxo-4-hydroxy-4-carboxy-5-ureidoimidazoline decarboxylase
LGNWRGWPRRQPGHDRGAGRADAEGQCILHEDGVQGGAGDHVLPSDLNNLDRAEFTRALRGVFENSPWIAERAWSARPFASIDDLHDAMVEVARQAPRSVQLALLRAYPDLAGRAARAGAMSASPVAEQASAGLDRLSDEEYERFNRLNAAYRERFDFPFIIAVRRHDKAAIFAAFEEQLGHGVDQEIRRLHGVFRQRSGVAVPCR